MLNKIKFLNFNYKLLIIVVVLCFFLVKYNNYNDYVFLTLVENKSNILENKDIIVEDFDAILVEGSNQNIDDNLVKKENKNSFFSWDTACKVAAFSIVFFSIYFFYRDCVLFETPIDLLELSNELSEDSDYSSANSIDEMSWNDISLAEELFHQVAIYSENEFDYLTLYNEEFVYLNDVAYADNLKIMLTHLDYIEDKLENYKDIIELQHPNVSFLDLENEQDFKVYENLVNLLDAELFEELDSLESSHIEVNPLVEKNLADLDIKYKFINSLKTMVINYFKNG